MEPAEPSKSSPKWWRWAPRLGLHKPIFPSIWLTKEVPGLPAHSDILDQLRHHHQPLQYLPGSVQAAPRTSLANVGLNWSQSDWLRHGDLWPGFAGLLGAPLHSREPRYRRRDLSAQPIECLDYHSSGAARWGSEPDLDFSALIVP